MADTHDNEARARAALDVFDDRDVDAILHVGDLASPDMVELLEGWRAWIVRGNVDHDPERIAEAAERVDGEIRYDEEFVLTFHDVEIAVHHGDDKARLSALIRDGGVDLVCHGHTHAFRDEVVDGTRVVNPGALHRTAEPSVCVYDPATGDLERILV